MDEYGDAATPDDAGTAEPAPAPPSAWPAYNPYGPGHTPAASTHEPAWHNQPAPPNPPAGYPPALPAAPTQPPGWGSIPSGSTPAGPPGGSGFPPGGYSGFYPSGPTPPERPPSRHRRIRTGIAVVGVVAAASVGVVIGHDAWTPASTTNSAAAAPSTTPTTGSGSSGTTTPTVTTPGTTSPSRGSGSTGSGSTGSGSTGSGSTGSGSSGSGTDPFGGSGSGTDPFGGTGTGSGSGTSGSTVTSEPGSPSDLSAIAKKVDPGLVDIDTTLSYQGEEAAGTGMVLTSTGEILTNNHVIDGETSIKVTDLGNGKTYSATIVGYDKTQDVAVLQLEHASGLTTVTLGDSSAVKAGEAVVGIGNAGGVGGKPSVAGGSVSATDQSITASDEGSATSERLHDLIETNADIQAGDSGGPLVNASGQVIGIDTAGSSGQDETQSSVTQGYSIPINEAVTLAKQIEAGTASTTVHIGATAFIGIEVESAGQGTTGFGSSSGSTTSGAEIAAVVPKSPASKAGLVAGDTIVDVNGKSVTSPTSLSTDMVAVKAGATVQLIYVDSSGQKQSVSVTLASGPPQ